MASLHPPAPSEDTPEGRLVSSLLEGWRREGVWPREERPRPAEEARALSALLAEGAVRREAGCHRLSAGALLRFGGEAELAGFDRLLPTLQEAFRRQPTRTWSCEELGSLAGLSPREVALTLDLFAAGLELSEALFGEEGGLVEALQLAPSVLETESFASLRARLRTQGPLEVPPRLVWLHVAGYRSLQGLELSPGALTVVLGAPGSGKSSLLDALALLALAAEHPLPSGVDAHAPSRLHLSLRLTSGPDRQLHYAVSLGGDVGVPRVTAEWLHGLERGTGGAAPEPFVLLDFRNGRGTVRAVTEPLSRPHVRTVSHVLAPDGLALRETLEPQPPAVASLRAFLSGWRFYPGFEVARGAASRRPVLSEPEPLLTAEGSNLSAVLFHLQAEHPERWRELEAHLREALPSFHSLSVKPRGGRGTVLGVWREAGVHAELSLAELSESTLRLVCLAALCLSPHKPSLLGLDAPERGLPPHWLPGLARLLTRAASETQVLVTTGSPVLWETVPAGARVLLEKREGRTVLGAGGGEAGPEPPRTPDGLRREGGPG